MSATWIWVVTALGLGVLLWVVRFLLRNWLNGRYRREVERRLDEAARRHAADGP